SASKIIADLALKQSALTFDSVPTDTSVNPVESNGIFDALATKQTALVFDAVPTDTSTNPVESNGVFDALALKAIDTNVVHKTGNETAAGAKTFTDKLTANDGFDAISTSSVPANVRSLGAKTYLRLTNNASSTGFIGYESTDLSLWTDNTKRVTVDSVGKVGIGIDVPYTRLEVYSTIASQTIGEAAGVGSIRDTSSAADLTGDSGLEFKIAGNSNGYGAKIQALNAGGAQLVFANRHGSSAWVERMRIDNDGDVGIGIAPDDKLHVDGNIKIKAAQKLYSAGYVTIEAGTGTGMQFNTDGANNRVQILSNGDVGIGTSPDAKLHIHGGDATKPALYLSGGTADIALP
ncbi:hypothetical protein, partial [Candidatus Venteria ishoeyi]|uniref:hypothetical protein n=1 Tax=Candidatus Venteria ishoeyi TaxID=1899563 RepID=UPI00255C2BFC